ncbi:MAG: phage terminase large subunit family protein, partial [Armatimonadetes bacterium]|nr:phage terminase large subunit family protein [Armatimonadota bacterium]
SPYGWQRHISTPSIPGYGVDAVYQQSDQKQWVNRCEACGHWQVLTYPDSLVQTGTDEAGQLQYDFGCLRCHRTGRIDRLAREWVVQHPSRRRHASGYQLSQLACPWLSATAIMRKAQDYRFPEQFFNYVLGLPYAGDNVLFTQPAIEAGIESYQLPGRPIPGAPAVAGVDWGDVSWVVIGQRVEGALLVVHVERLAQRHPDEQVARVAEIMRTYDVRYLVADAGYGKDRNAALLQAFPGRVYSCFYPVLPETSKVFQPQWQDDQAKVTVDRTTSFKLLAKALRDRDLRFCDFRRTAIWLEVLAHLLSLVSHREDDDDRGLVETIKHRGPDHLAHAFNYLWTAYAKLARTEDRSFYISAFADDVPGNRAPTGVEILGWPFFR